MNEETKDRSIQNSNKDKQIIFLRKEIERLRLLIEENQRTKTKGDKYADLLSSLFIKWIIDSEGRLLIITIKIRFKISC